MGFTALLSVSLFLAVEHGRESSLDLAVTTVRANAFTDLRYRDLLAESSGAYLQVSERVIPDPALATHTDRDITLPDGRRFTRILPTYFYRLVHGTDPGVPMRVDVKTFQPLGPDDTPDTWERSALARLRAGAAEVYDVVPANGISHLRFMSRLLATEGCVRNRPGQGIKAGDLLGGLSVTLPMTGFDAAYKGHVRVVLFMHLGLWLLGLLGIGWSSRKIGIRDDAVRRAEQEIRQSYREMRVIFDATSIGMAKLSGSGTVIRANRALLRLCSPDSNCNEMVSRQFEKMLPFENPDCFLSAFSLAQSGALNAECEVAILGPDGARFYHLSVTALDIVAGNLDEYLVSLGDITVQHRAKIRERETREELGKIFDAIDEIITIQDAEMRITGVNRAACKQFGVSAEALIGRYCYEVFRGANSPCPDCPELASLKDGEPHVAEIEHRNLNKIFSVSAAPLVDKDGKVVKVVHCARDLTEKRALEKQLRQAQKMEAIGTLAGGIAHDFNNILTAIIGYSELSILKLPNDSPMRADIDKVLQAGLRAKELIKQILTFSRQAEQKMQPLSLQPIAKEAFKLLRATLPTTIELRQHIADCGMVIADPTQMHQVIMNLCTNGYHAMLEKGGVLGVTMEMVELRPDDVKNKVVLKPGNYVRLSVSDTGSGIAPEIRERIFEPYFTTKKKGDGTGLGLSVVHGIIQGLGGHVSVYSEPGAGTTFHVYLPLLEASPGLLPVESAADVQIPTGSERVLVLDDERDVVDTEERILGSLGYMVRAFVNCTEAMNEFFREPNGYDLIITDMSMPKISGMELVAAVREVRPDIPIIMCTGFSEIMNEEKARQLGINKLVMKPVTIKELAQSVREVLDAAREKKGRNEG